MSANANEITPDAAAATSATLRHCLERQRRAYLADPVPDYDSRRRDLLALKRLVSENTEAIIEAINADYGNRSRHETQFADLLPVTDGINDILGHLKRWMKPQRRHVDALLYPGGRNRVYPQPLGVVGIIVPWNFPMYLSVLPLAYAFAAGNRAMVKMSENSIALTRLLIELSPKYFPPEKLSWFEETGGVGIEFSQLPFDLIMFTGSGQTGRSVTSTRWGTPTWTWIRCACPAWPACSHSGSPRSTRPHGPVLTPRRPRRRRAHRAIPGSCRRTMWLG